MTYLFMVLACSQTVSRDRVEPTFIQVEIAEGDKGSVDDPLPFSSEPQARTIRVQTLDLNADPVEFTGDLKLNVRPGKLEGSPWIRLDGQSEWTGEVSFYNGFADTRIWVSDEGDRTDDTRTPSFASGVSDSMWFELPTLSEMNDIDDHETNQLESEFAEIRAADRDIRVTALGTAGYWVMDMADEPGSHNYLFIYTFSKPDDEVQLGSRITLLTGSNQEYLATTQFSFPKYDVGDDELVELPDPGELSEAMCGDNDTLEGWESAVVQLTDLRVPEDFGPGNEDYEDYLEYGQWPVEFEPGSCKFYLDSALSIPDFVPEAGMEIDRAAGLLSEIWGQWILLPRDNEDLDLANSPPPPANANASRPRLPLPRGHNHADIRQSDPCLP